MPRSSSTRAVETTPLPHHWQLLPGADFVDSFRIGLPAALAQQDAVEITQRMLAAQPAWVTALLKLRNTLVAPLGLKSARLAVGEHQISDASQGFPLLRADARQVLMGMDDHHLDFRLCVEKTVPDAADGIVWLTATTVVRTRHLLGRAYLTAIMPFHRRIVLTLLNGLPRE